MIPVQTIEALAREHLQGSPLSLVEATVSEENEIEVIIAREGGGVSIDDCVALSRFIEERLDREVEDYELEVGSAGLGQPFKVQQQYVNHVGDDVEVVTADGKKIVGVLKQVDGCRFTVTTQEKQVPEGKKRPVKVEVDREFSMDEVKSTRYLLAFK